MVGRTVVYSGCEHGNFLGVTGRDFVECISFHCYKEIHEAWHLERKELYSGSWFGRCKVWGPHLVMAFFLAKSQVGTGHHIAEISSVHVCICVVFLTL